MLFFAMIGHFIVNAQVPGEEEAIGLVITQKKASDSKDAFPFTLAPGSKPKLLPGHYTNHFNNECLVICSFLQGREFVQVVLLLYQSNDGHWKNGCWYYDNIYRLKVKDLNKDAILELILETKINSGNRVYGNYKIISLLNQNTTIWYENSSILGVDQNSIRNTPKGKEITKDVKVTLIDSIQNLPVIIKERTTIARFNNYTDSAGVKFDYDTKVKEYRFVAEKYIPKLD